MRRYLIFILAFLLFAASAAAETQATTTDLPVRVIDRTSDPAACPDFAFPEGAKLLEVVFPQVRDTDACLLRLDGKTLLIDCSSAQQSGRVTDMLSLLGVTELDAVVNTHPHYDHLQGLENLMKAVQLDELRICFHERTNSVMEQAVALCEENGVPVTHYQDEDVMQLGDATLVTWLKGDADWNLNENSAQILLTYGERTMLFTADMMMKTQLRLLERIPAEALHADILKYPHHGLNRMQDAFLSALDPAFGIVTNSGGRGANGTYCLSRHGIPYSLTVGGYVYLTTDGTTWLCEKLTAEQLAEHAAK